MLGATGSLGSRVREHLVLRGWNVLTAGRGVPPFKNNIPWSEVFSDNSVERRFDLILNCASPNRKFAEENPTYFYSWMVENGEALIKLAKRARASSAISLSTVHVYGSTAYGKISEDSPLMGQDPYARGHILREAKLLADSNWQVIRLSNTFGTPGYGGKLDLASLTNSLVRRWATGRGSPVDTTQLVSRDFLPISSFLDILERVVEAPLESPLVNIVSGRRVTVRDWCRYVVAVLEERQEIHLPPSSQVDHLQISSVMGWPSSERLSDDSRQEILNLGEYFVRNDKEITNA